MRVLNKFIVQKHDNANVKEMFSVVKLVSDHTKQYTDAITFSIQSCRSCYVTQHLCQRSFYKIFVIFRNSKKNVLKIVLIIVNINKDECKSLISNQFSFKNDPPPISWRTILRR